MPFNYHLVETFDTPGYESNRARDTFYSKSVIGFDSIPSQCMALLASSGTLSDYAYVMLCVLIQ